MKKQEEINTTTVGSISNSSQNVLQSPLFSPAQNDKNIQQKNRLPSYQDLLEEQGGFGKFQLIQFILICLQINSDGFLIYNLTYLLLYPKFDCEWIDPSKHIDDPNSSDYCKPSYFCKNTDIISYSVDQSSTITLVNWIDRFDLTCQDSIIISLFGMLYFTGFAVSSLFVPSLQDKHGRKKVFVIAMAVQLLTLIIILIMPGHKMLSVYTIYICMLVNGVSSFGRASTGYNYFSEFVPKDSQSTIGTIWIVMEAVVYILLTIYFRYINKNWIWSVFVGLILNLVCTMLTIILIPESSMWLYDKKRYKECYQVIKYMAAFNSIEQTPLASQLVMVNKFEIKEDSPLNRQEIEQEKGYLIPKDRDFEQTLSNQPDVKQSPWVQIMNDKRILFNMIGMSMVWLSASFCYYLISYQLKYLQGDLYTNGISSSSSEIVAYCLSGLVYKKLGLKLTLSLSYMIGFAGMISLILVKTESQFWIALFILGSKFGISSVYNIAYIGNTEIFPISVVATSFGVCNLVSRLATIFSPFVAELQPESISQWIFNVVLILAFSMMLLVKQTESDSDRLMQENQKQSLNRLKKIQLMAIEKNI